MKGRTHSYTDEDETEDNAHEYQGDHGMSDAQMRAMFAANRQAGPGKGGIAKPGKLADPSKKLGGERANLMTVVRSKPHTPDMARKTKPTVAAKPAATPAKAPSATFHAPKASSAAHAPTSGKKGGHSPSGGKGGGHEGGGHSPLSILKKIGGAAKEAAHEATKGVVLATGNEPITHDVKKSLRGHKFGDPESGRHEDR